MTRLCTRLHAWLYSFFSTHVLRAWGIISDLIAFSQDLGGGVDCKNFLKLNELPQRFFQASKRAQNLENLRFFERPYLPFLRSLMFSKKIVFQISEKTIGDNHHNVYIFGMGEAKPFQNRFNHVHTTLLDNSTDPRLGTVI